MGESQLVEVFTEAVQELEVKGFIRSHSFTKCGNELFLLPLCVTAIAYKSNFPFRRQIYSDFLLLSDEARVTVLCKHGFGVMKFISKDMFIKSASLISRAVDKFYICPVELRDFSKVWESAWNKYRRVHLVNPGAVTGVLQVMDDRNSINTIKNLLFDVVSGFRELPIDACLACICCVVSIYVSRNKLAYERDFSWEKACLNIDELYVEDLFLWSLYEAALCAGCWPTLKEIQV